MIISESQNSGDISISIIAVDPQLNARNLCYTVELPFKYLKKQQTDQVKTSQNLVNTRHDCHKLWQFWPTLPYLPNISKLRISVPFHFVLSMANLSTKY